MKMLQLISLIIIGFILSEKLSFKKMLNTNSPKYKAIIKEMKLLDKANVKEDNHLDETNINPNKDNDLGIDF